LRFPQHSIECKAILLLQISFLLRWYANTCDHRVQETTDFTGSLMNVRKKALLWAHRDWKEHKISTRQISIIMVAPKLNVQTANTNHQTRSCATYRATMQPIKRYIKSLPVQQ
jgi:hypothetical protein